MQDNWRVQERETAKNGTLSSAAILQLRRAKAQRKAAETEFREKYCTGENGIALFRRVNKTYRRVAKSQRKQSKSKTQYQLTPKRKDICRGDKVSGKRKAAADGSESVVSRATNAGVFDDECPSGLRGGAPSKKCIRTETTISTQFPTDQAEYGWHLFNSDEVVSARVGSSSATARAIGNGVYSAQEHPHKAIVNAHLALLAATAKPMPSLQSDCRPRWSLVLDTRALVTVQALCTGPNASTNEEFIIIPNPDLEECLVMRQQLSKAVVVPVTSHILLKNFSPRQMTTATRESDPLRVTDDGTGRTVAWESLNHYIAHKGWGGFSFVFVSCRNIAINDIRTLCACACE